MLTLPIEVRSDTQGVDLRPFVRDVYRRIRSNWSMLIPPNGRGKLGKASLDFTILKDGSVRDIRLIFSSGDVSLDRAAWGGITSAAPFHALPTEFKGDHIVVRCAFVNNP